MQAFQTLKCREPLSCLYWPSTKIANWRLSGMQFHKNFVSIWECTDHLWGVMVRGWLQFAIIEWATHLNNARSMERVETIGELTENADESTKLVIAGDVVSCWELNHENCLCSSFGAETPNAKLPKLLRILGRRVCFSVTNKVRKELQLLSFLASTVLVVIEPSSWNFFVCYLHEAWIFKSLFIWRFL